MEASWFSAVPKRLSWARRAPSAFVTLPWALVAAPRAGYDRFRERRPGAHGSYRPLCRRVLGSCSALGQLQQRGTANHCLPARQDSSLRRTELFARLVRGKAVRGREWDLHPGDHSCARARPPLVKHLHLPGQAEARRAERPCRREGGPLAQSSAARLTSVLTALPVSGTWAPGGWARRKTAGRA